MNYIDLLASFAVAAIAFWTPLNAVSLMLAFAGCVLSFLGKGENQMSSRIQTVSQGISGTERPGSWIPASVGTIVTQKCRV